MGKDMEGHCLYYPGIRLEGLRKTTLFEIVGVMAEILTGYFPDTSPGPATSREIKLK
jgi:hypothetical protein